MRTVPAPGVPAPGANRGRGERGASRDGRGAKVERGASRDGRNETWGRRDSELTPEELRARGLKRVRERHDDPEIDADVTPEMLNRSAYNDLKTLDKENADLVARHLVMAVRLLDENPELAHQHAISASRRAGRIGIVREALGITAYSIGDFALALRELRTYQRITGRNDQVPPMVDAERGVGRADRALELGRSLDRSTLEDSVAVELAIAMSGARLDLGQLAEALVELEIPQLDASTAYSWSPALFDAYAVVLAELGRDEEAAEWGRRADIAAEALAEALSTEGDETIEIVELEGDALPVADATVRAEDDRPTEGDDAR